MKSGMNKTRLGKLAFLGVVFSLLIFTFSLTTCSNPAGDEESGEMGTFTINLGGNGRAVGYPPTSEINNIKFTVTFKQGATVKGPFTADGTYTLTGKIPIGVYDTVEVEVFDKTDGDSVLAVGGLTSGGPITIHTGNNAIHVTLYKTVRVSPDSPTVSRGGSQPFAATVYGQPPGTPVTWAVSPTSGGSTIIAGVLNVAAGETATALEVSASYGSSPVWRGTVNVALSSLVNAQSPLITTQPVDATYVEGATPSALTVAASVTDGGTLSYQWRSSSSTPLNFLTDGTAVGTNSNTYTPSTTTVGTIYYWVVVTNTITDNFDGGQKVVNAISDLVTVEILFGGDGSPTYPFLVYDVITLQAVGRSTAPYATWTLSVNYKQIEDITLPTVPLGSSNWTPIGANFTGTYDGNGKTIDVLTITGTGHYQAMFTNLYTGAIVKDLRLTNVNITTGSAFDYYGGIAGYNQSGGIIQNCHVSGIISAQGTVGGVAGSNTLGSTVQSCSFTGTVTGTSNVGGIVGSNAGGTSSKVQGCYVTSGTITATSDYVGGIVGNNDGTVGTCFVSGTVSVSVSGNNHIGGIVGINDNGGRVENCYISDTVSVSGASYMGGIAGSNIGGSTVQYCYAAGTVSASGLLIGGVAGQHNGTVQNCVALNQSISTTNSTSAIGRVQGGTLGGPIVGLSDNHARTSLVPTTAGSHIADNTLTGKDGQDVSPGTSSVQYNNQSFWTALGWNFTTIWQMGSGANPLPELQ